MKAGAAGALEAAAGGAAGPAASSLRTGAFTRWPHEKLTGTRGRGFGASEVRISRQWTIYSSRIVASAAHPCRLLLSTAHATTASVRLLGVEAEVAHPDRDLGHEMRCQQRARPALPDIGIAARRGLAMHGRVQC